MPRRRPRRRPSRRTRTRSRTSRRRCARWPRGATWTSRTCSPSRGGRPGCRPAPLPCRRPASPPASPRARGRTRIFAYPGVPYEFQQMWLETAAALERDGFFPDVAVRTVRVFGVGELQVGPVIDALPSDQVELGINVGGGEVTVKIRYRREPGPQAQADALVAALEAGVPVYSTDGRTVDDLIADGTARDREDPGRRGILHRRAARRPAHGEARQFGLLQRRRDQLLEPGEDGPARRAAGHAGPVRRRVGGGRRRDGRRRARRSRQRLRALDHRRGRSRRRAPQRSPSASCTWGAPAPAGTQVRKGHFPGDRDTVRMFSATSALHLLRQALSS